jgi:hypothetical protein
MSRMNQKSCRNEKKLNSSNSKFIPDQMILNACVEAGHRWRERKLGPVLTVQLLLLQLLSGVAMIRLDRLAQLGVSAAAVCRSRARLPLQVWMKLAEWSGRASRNCGKVGRYAGHRVMVCDGTIAKVIDLPHARGEQMVLTRMIKWLMRGDLLLGDRGLVSFAHLACFMAAKIQCMMRLPRPWVIHGRGKGIRRRQKQLGPQDMLVRWEKPARHHVKWMSKFGWKKLPQFLMLRQISFQLHRKGFRSQWVWVITTLTDSKKQVHPVHA